MFERHDQPSAQPVSDVELLRRELDRWKDLEGALREAHADTELLYRLTDAVVQSETLEEIYEHALEAATTGLRAERASVLVFDGAKVMRFRAWRGLSDDYRAAVDGHSPWTADATDPTPVVINDVEADPSMAPYLPVFRAEDIRALGFFPLVHRRRLLGKFMIYGREPRVFSERDVRLALAIGSHVAQAVARRTAEDEIVRLLEQAKAAQRAAESAVRARDEMLAIVSHDLRNPVNTVSLSATSLMKMANDRQDERLRLQVQRLQRSLGTMSRLIGDLLDVGAIEGSGLQVIADEHELDGIIDDAMDLLRPIADERAQRLVVEVPRGLRLHADRERVIQILSNLVGNAIKFTPSGGSIALTGCARDAGGRAFVELAITDTGPGIAAEHLPRIFDRFCRPKQGRRGVGLGLAIAKGVVEAHGGEIRVESVPGAGATFRFTLPAAPA